MVLYDTTSNTWQFNWKTSNSADPAGCYNINITSGLSAQTNRGFLIQLRK